MSVKALTWAGIVVFLAIFWSAVGWVATWLV